MIHITGWGAFWLIVGVIGIIKLLTITFIKLYSVRQIVKILDTMIADDGIKEEEIGIIRNMVDGLK